MTIRELLEKHPQGLTIDEIRLKSKLPHKTVKEQLNKLPVEFDGEFYYLYTSPEHRQQIKEQIMNTSKTEPITAKQVKRNKPFTPNPTTGYQVMAGKVKIFLDRKASSKTLTLSIEDLEELVNAVRKGVA